MKAEKLLIGVIIVLLILGVLTPTVLLLFVSDRVLAGQIGDALGGTSAPFINLSAIIIVLVTFLYQKRDDKKNYEKQFIIETFETIKDEFSKIYLDKTVSKGVEEQESSLYGRKALLGWIKIINTSGQPLEYFQELNQYKAILNVFSATKSLLLILDDSIHIQSTEKKLITSRVSLFYRNNMYVSMKERGAVFCDYHNVKHEIPRELFDVMKQIEERI